MIFRKLIHFSLLSLAFGMILLPQTVSACATCFGKSDSKLAQGMNMGIFSLLGVVVFVLGGIAVFFVHLAKRSVKTPMPAADDELLEASKTTL